MLERKTGPRVYLGTAAAFLVDSINKGLTNPPNIEMLVSQHKDTPTKTPIYYDPYYGTPNMVPLLLGKPQIP